MDKLKRSIRAAGADEKTSSAIASRIKPSEGWSTTDVRSKVINELKQQDSKIAESYEKYEKKHTAKGR